MKWEESDSIVDQMIKGSTGELWGHRLEQSNHYGLLKHVLDIAEIRGGLLDVGCGAGDVSRSWNEDYTGADLGWIIEKVSKLCNPSKNYVSMDITKENISNLPHSRVVLMNAFLDVREDAHEIFEEILKIKSEKIIVHRQRLSQQNDRIEYQKSYGGSVIPSSIMSIEKINNLSKSLFPNSNILIFHWQNDYYTFIVSKNEIC